MAQTQNIKIPIYRTTTKPEFSYENSNAGLWYDKFCDTWESIESKKIGFGDNGKRTWLEKITNHRIGNEWLLKEMLSRQKELTNAKGGKVLVFQTQGPFVSGLGRSHPIENGFAFHHTLGVPYLPGSSVKGLVRAWVEHWLNDKKEDIKRIFGDNEDGVGSVIFLDAIPIEPVELKMDIMTPHYSKYYQGKDVPGDWDSPNPIPFMVVNKETKFQFGVLPRRTNNEQDKQDCEKAIGWLTEALANIGAGAKTAVGYGRFEKINPAIKWIEDNVSMEKEKDLKRKVIANAENLANKCKDIPDAESELRKEVKEELTKIIDEYMKSAKPTGGVKKAKKILEDLK